MADGKITIDTMVDKKGAEKDIKGLQDKLEGTAKKMKNVGGQMTKYVTAPLVGLGAVAGTAMVKFGNLADELLDLSAITGLSTDELQRWRQIATDAGVDTDVVANSLQTLNKQLERGNEISPRLAKGFDTMNTSAEDFKKMNPDDQMRKMIGTMLELEGADRRAFANQMNMADILPLVSELESKGGDLDQIMSEIDVPFSEDELNQMNDFRKEWDNLKYTLENVLGQALQPLFELFNKNKDAIMGSLIPAIQGLVEKVVGLVTWFTDLSPTMQKTIGIIVGLVAVLGPLLVVAGMLVSAFVTLMPIIAGVGSALMLLLNPIPMIILGIGALVILIIGYWDEIKAVTVAVFTAIGDFFVATWEWIKNIFTATVDAIATGIKVSWEWIKKVTDATFTAIGDGLKAIWNGIKKAITTAINGIKNTVSSVWNGIKSVTSSVWGGIKSTITNIVDGVWGTIKKVFGNIKNFIGDTWDGVKSGTEKVWDGITGSVKGAVNGVIGAINGMIGALNGLDIKLPKIPNWVPGLGGKGGGSIGFPDIPKIPSLDVGTNFVAQDGLAMIHKGEAVVPKEYNPAAGGAGGSMHLEVVYNVDGEELYRVVEPHMDVSLQDKITFEAYMKGEK
ncbi:phage tail tape measure protein, TP901 family, core region [Oceanobacillus picturae]|uniref:Phage tail tape measure protein, TP901 family, core region n=1 Tax=Oceanobacillus picturae TaxID=171693 RepID=A0A0U9HE58_9BACI|nr:hypothetical protein [Oceanobacillus picturae]GAQ18038.1 phage tail tape measure protein, TP901 family, core region [Oceanobacillus picturae]